MSRVRCLSAALVMAFAGAILLLPAAARAQDQPDFLSPAEADKVRDAVNAGDRIKLFLDFAQDRLKKVQYELQLTNPQVDKPQLLKGLLQGYSSCMDEAADRIQEGQHAAAKIRPAIKDMEKRAKGYLETLKAIEGANGPELASYKDSLDDAISSTQDAVADAEKASKEYGSGPIRRKQ